MGNRKSLRGFQDIYGNEATKFHAVIESFIGLTLKYNCKLVYTPILENEALFLTQLGEVSDIVTKEMYSFKDKNGDRVTLRPEGTAPVVRSLIDNKLYEKLPINLAYYGPMFRYERPQRGRYRQFHQLGIEFFGEAAPIRDVEGILLATDLIKALKIPSNYKLKINSLGDADDHAMYTNILKEYLEKHYNSLSELSKVRFFKNPLRILDSKEIEDLEIVRNAPNLINLLKPSSRKYYESVKELLNELCIEFYEDKTLVRGLDYYTNTIFEFESSLIGAQTTFLAGGRYDDMVAMLGGPKISGFGWAAGYERLNMISQLELPMEELFAVLSDEASYSLKTSYMLRSAGFNAVVFLGNSFKELIKKALQEEATFAIFLGENERNSESITIKNLNTKEQLAIPVTKLVEYCNTLLNKKN